MTSGVIGATRRMMTLLVALIAVGTATGYETLELRIAGFDRWARVYPGDAAGTLDSPLVLLFHGRGDSVRNFAAAVAFHKDWPEATIIYPAGRVVPEENNMTGWQGRSGRDPHHDVAFVEALIDAAAARYRVDRQRVYAGGFSNGARFTFILMTDRPEIFAAFAPVGAVSDYIENASRPRPVIYLFGKDEPKRYARDWAETLVRLSRVNRADGSKVEWAPGYMAFPHSAGGAITVWHVYPAGHIWPYTGNEHIVRFFKTHRLTDPVTID